MKFKNLSVIFVSTIILMTPVKIFAYEKGDVLLKFGTATLDPKSRSDDIDQLPGEAITANSNIQLGISGTYFLSDKLGLELLGVSPFTNDINAVGGTLGGAGIGNVKNLPPTLTLQYYFLGSKRRFKPFVGLGLNYTIFFDAETDSDAEGLGFSDLEVDDSFGLSAQLGFDYQITSKWALNATVMLVDIDTTATLSGEGVDDLDVDFDVDPFVYRLNLVYKF